MLLVRESINSGLLFDLAKLDQEISELTYKSEQENFWSDNREALKVISRLNYVKNIVETYRKLESDYSDLNELLEMASVDAVLNLVNIDKFVSQVEAAQAAARKAEEERIAAEAAQKQAGEVVGETKKEEEK